MRTQPNATSAAILATLTAALGLALSPPAAGAGTLVSIEDPDPFALHSAAFELARGGEVQIDAVGIRSHSDHDLLVDAWLLDAKTRKPVWVMRPEDTDRAGRRRDLRRATETLRLEPGRYELYLFAGVDREDAGGGSFGNVRVFDLGHLRRQLDRLEDLRQSFGRLDRYRDRRDDRDAEDDAWGDSSRKDDSRRDAEWEDEDDGVWDDDDDGRDRDRDSGRDRDRDSGRDRDRDDGRPRDRGPIILRSDWSGGWRSSNDLIEDLIDRCYVKLTSTDLTGGDVRAVEVDGGFPNALIRHQRLGNSEFVHTGFVLDRGMDLRIVSVFEYPRGSKAPADFGWIVDAGSRERVWHPRRRDARRAGGGSKNRRIDQQVHLPAGRYILYFGTDDSHSFEAFNVHPPYDPVNWGITVLPGDDFDRAAFSSFDPTPRGQPLLAHTGAEDYEVYEQPFRLAHHATLQVLALGEYDLSNDEFVDHGWIADARSGEPVWRMRRGNTMPAGGGAKNRMFDGMVRLPAGEYVASYVTDDSHSYEEWNTAAPFMPKAWGISIFAGPGMQAGDFTKLSEDQLTRDPDLLVRMVGVGDDERRRQRFTLGRRTRLHIHALGEGMRGRMADYGTIVDLDSDRVVWEMEYRDTQRAGGARKNRLFDDEIELPAGSYRAIYRTDGSHSFEDWNDAQPREPWNWGMTIRKAD